MRQEAENLLAAFLKKERTREQLTICMDRILTAAERCLNQIPEKTRRNLRPKQANDWHPNGFRGLVISLEKFEIELAALVTKALQESTDVETLLSFGLGLNSLVNYLQNIIIKLDRK
jgi:hypothetical protein